MMGLVVISAVLLAIILLWIIGELKNIRALRIAGALVPLLAVPLAFQFGVVVGHGRAYVAARAATDEFLVAASEALERGDRDRILQETRWLHESSADHDKRAGSFFLFDMQSAKNRLDAVNPPGLGGTP